MKFSVLMSIYYKEKDEYFNRAMESIWYEQTIKPTEIILVQDGPLTEDLYVIIEKWKKILNKVLKIIPLKENLGLGDALNIGLENCSNELVARMDTDDISLPDRFEKQLKIFENKNIDICSSWISEFDEDEKKIISFRKLPEFHNQLRYYAKKRCPINHPAVMYRKQSVLAVDSYKKLMWFEDYYLWVRMFLNNSIFYNIQEPLVNMRAGYGQLERRRGLIYAISEYKMQKKFLSLHFINVFEFVRNIIIRFTTRILPGNLVKQIYMILRK